MATRSARFFRHGDLDGARIHLIGGQALEFADGHRLVHLAAPAGVLAAVGADAPQHAGQRQVVHDDFQGLGVFALAHHLNVALDVDARRAGQAAGCLVGFFDGVVDGDGLGVLLVGRLAVDQSQVVIVGQGDWTGLGAVAATGAQVGVDAGGPLVDRRRKVTRPAVETIEIGIGDQLDVHVSSHFHQNGTHDAHGAVVGGKGLVQLGHDPADGRRFLKQIDIIPRIRQIQGTLHSGDTPANNQHGTNGVLCHRFSPDRA